MAEINYNKTTDETQQNFLAIPSGDYPAVIIESDYKKNNKETGMLLFLKWEIIDGRYKGRKIPDIFHLEHENLQTKQIGERRFNSLKQTLKVNIPQDSSQLHNIPCIICIKAIKDEEFGDENGMKNEIKRYKSIENEIKKSKPDMNNTEKPWDKNYPSESNNNILEQPKKPWER